MKYDFDKFNDKPNATKKSAKSSKKRVANKHKASKTKKNNAVVYIALAVVLALIVCALVLLLSKPKVTGTWLHKTESSGDFYYTLYKENGECKVDISQGTIHYTGTYELTNKTITFDIKYGKPYEQALNSTYDYDLSKNKLILFADDESTTELTKTNSVKYTDYVKPYDNFKTDGNLTGAWVYNYEGLGDRTLTINDDGTMIIDSFGAGYQECVYSAENNEIKLSFYDTKLHEQTEQYRITDNQLEFLGTIWTKQ